jgi:hypothetical protein
MFGIGGECGIIVNRLKIEFDCLTNVLEGLIFGATLADSPGKSRNDNGVTTLITGFHDDFDVHDLPPIQSISEPFLRCKIHGKPTATTAPRFSPSAECFCSAIFTG